MSLPETITLIKEDNKRARWKCFIINLFVPSFALIFWFRIVNLLHGKIILIPFYSLAYLIFEGYKHLTGIQLFDNCIIGGGLRFFHYSSIVIARKAIIGKNCSIHQGVTIGKKFGGNHYGFPTIGDNCIVFPGASIVGNIRVGDNVIVGTNSFVDKDIPDNCVVVGSPARVVSNNSREAIEDWDYCNYFKLKL